MNRRGSEAAVRLAAILKVATHLFLRHGYGGTSFNDVLVNSGQLEAVVKLGAQVIRGQCPSR